MPAESCAHTKPDGSPCAARPLPGSTFCLFHDPAHQDALAQSRSKGGSTPRRRIRRYPRLLDHMHVAELLSELFIDTLNDPEAIDTRRLHALIALARTLLKAVGTPPTFLVHSDRREPSPSAAHLLRVYPPPTPEVEALLAAEPPVAADDPAAQASPPAAGSPVEAIRTLDVGDGDAWHAAAEFLTMRAPSAAPPTPPPAVRSRLVDVNASLEELATVGFPVRPAAAAAPTSSAAPPPSVPTTTEQAPEQDPDRPRTGPLPSADLYQHLLAALTRRPAADPPPP